MEQARPQAMISEYFSELEDPRKYNRRRKLLDILVSAICAGIRGADGWEDVELYRQNSAERSLGAKHKKAARDNDYLLTVLTG